MATDPTGTASTSELSSIRIVFAEAVDASTFGPSDVTLTGPLGPIAVDAVTVVSGTADTQFDVTFSSQTTYGGYAVTVGPDVFDPASYPMNQDQDAVAGEATEDRFTATIYLGAPSLKINDVTAVEGDAGTTDLQFTVTRTGDPSLAFTVDYYTTNDTARAVDDGVIPTFHRHTVAWYENDGVGNFVSATITISADYALFVTAADVDGDSDNDVLTASWMDDTVAWFENSFYNPDRADYQPVSGTLSFAAGETEKTIAVTVTGDQDVEADEAFHITLANAGISIGDKRGVGTIQNDDQPIVLFADSFEVSEWNGLWVEDAQNDWYRSTQRASDGTQSAEVDGSATDATLTITSSVDLTPYGTVELSFSWYLESGFDAGEYVALDLFNGTWHNSVAILQGNVDAEDSWHNESIQLDPSYLVGNFRLRFRSLVSSSTEDANVDYVVLLATSLAGPPNVPPVADAGGPYAGQPNVSLAFAGSASDPGRCAEAELFTAAWSMSLGASSRAHKTPGGRWPPWPIGRTVANKHLSENQKTPSPFPLSPEAGERVLG